MCTRHLILTTLFCIALAGSAVASMQAGAGVRSIGPFDLNKTWLGGFGEPRPAQGIHDDIKARAMALSDGNETILLIGLDLTAYNSWRINPLREAIGDKHGIPTRNILVASTHTHAAPDAMGVWGPNQITSGRYPPYNDFVDEQILNVADDALDSMEPARVRVGLGTIPLDMLVDKRDPQVFDQELLSLQAVGADGNAVFTLVNAAVHPEVTFNENLLVTADFPYFMHQTIEGRFGGVSIFTAGNLGGLIAPQTVDFSFAECERYGNDIADIAIASLENEPLLEDVPLVTDARNVLIPITNPLYIVMGTIGLLEIDWEWLQARGEGVPVDVVYWQIGTIAELVSLPGELFPESGEDLKSFMKTDRRFCVNLGNEEIGYLVPVEDFQYPEDVFNPESNYEETLSPGIEAVPAVFTALYEMLDVASPTPFPTATETPTPSPTPTPTPEPQRDPVGVAIWSDVTSSALTVDLQVWNDDASEQPISLYVAAEIAGTFYFASGFTETATPLASFGLAGGYDSERFELYNVPLGEATGGLAVTWYGALLDTLDGTALSLSQASVTLP